MRSQDGTTGLWPELASLASALAIALAMAAPPPAHGAAFTVTSTSDGGPGSLRQAILDANASPGADTIGFSLSGCPCTIIPATRLPSITEDLALDGPEANALTISGHALERDAPVLAVHSGTVDLQGVTIANGDSGIANGGTLTVRNSILATNEANGVVNSGKLTIIGSTFVGNGDDDATGSAIFNWPDAAAVVSDTLFVNNRGAFGGAIFNLGRTLTVVDSIFASNEASEGGAIFNRDGTVLVSHSTFSTNFASAGAGIFNDDNSRGVNLVTVIDSVFDGNSASNSGAGIWNQSALTVSNSTFARNLATFAAAIENAFGSLTVRNSTFVANSAVADIGPTGAIDNQRFANATVSNSTFSANRATGALGAGGIKNHGALRLSNSTFFANGATGDSSAGGFANFGGTATLENVLMAGSPSGANCSGDLLAADSTHNMADDASCGVGFSQRTIAEIRLGPLGNHGGPTQTHALLKGSAAIDTGDPPTCAAPPVDNRDQRGRPRPVDGNGGRGAVCDIGSYEFSPLDAMGELIIAVLDLAVRRALDDGQASSLIGKLQHGRSTTATLNRLDAFVHEVGGLVGQGALTLEQGQALTDAANEIGASLAP